MNVSRRRFLKLGAMAGAGLVLPLGTLSIPLSRLAASTSVRSPSVEPFKVPLPIPPTLKPVRRGADTDYYEMTQRAERQEILPGLKTEVWGYEGMFPGPTVEVRSGRNVEIRQWNELPVPVSTHLHGGKTPPESDGYPTDLILPKGHGSGSFAHTGHSSTKGHPHFFKDYRYPNEQRAATLWYHDHRMDFTGPQVYKGLAGLYILRDEVENSLSLPRGEKEVPLVIADRTFNEDGSFYYPSIDPSLKGEPGVLSSATNGTYSGVFGDTILVNGAPWPQMEVSNTMYRFRILNASNARAYELALDPPPPGGEPLVQVGSDGGLLKAPIPHDRILTSPGERFDVVVDFSRYRVGQGVTLRNLREEGRTSEVMRFVVARREKEDSSMPDLFVPELNVPDPDHAEVSRRFQFIAGVLGGMSTVNGRVFDPDRIDATPRLGSTEIWEISGDPAHPIHLHLVQFRVVSRDDGLPGPYDAGWKDTVFLEGGTVRVIARFDGYRGKYAFHCHNLEHEDMMMMANFKVI
jgi:FtsP/CotA-like multicopper oxidase with cupredoxin domain